MGRTWREWSCIPRPLAALIGLVSVWPVVCFFAFVAFMFSTMPFAGKAPPEAVFGYLFVAHVATMLVILALLAFYVAHLFRNEALASDRRILWMLVLFLGNAFAFPVYWYLYVWRAPSRSLPDRPQQPTGGATGPV